MSKSNILICVSGSIAAYKAASLASALVKDEYSVRCTATDKALEFGEIHVKTQTTDEVVHLIEWRDGTLLDTIKKTV